MMTSVRGGDAVRGVLLLALPILLSILVCALCEGCRQVAPSVVPRHYVYIETLLPLHPAWSQVAMLEEEAHRFTALRPRPDTVLLDLPALPHNFDPPQQVPPSLARERQARLAAEVQRRIERTTARIKASNDAKYRLQERLDRAKTRATYRGELTAAILALQQQRAREAAELQKRIDRLAFRVVALESSLRLQTNAYGDRPSQVRDDADLQLKTVNREIADLSDQRDKKLDNDAAIADATAALEPRRLQLERDLAASLAAYRDQLNQSAADEIARLRARLAQQPDPIPSIDAVRPPPQYVHETPLPFPTRQETLRAIQVAQTAVNADAGRVQDGWRGQQERLIAMIRADTRQAVEEIARQQGWKLVPFGSAGATDATSEARKAIQDQWRIAAPSR